MMPLGGAFHLAGLGKEKARRVALPRYARRFKQITDMLGGCYITSGWSDVYDQGEARRLLKYLAGHPAGYHRKNSDALYRFMLVHGQDLNYLHEGDPKFMIAGLAKASPLARAIPVELRHDEVNAAYEHRIDELICELAQEIAGRRAVGAAS